jgi:hypothetical protein
VTELRTIAAAAKISSQAYIPTPITGTELSGECYCSS